MCSKTHATVAGSFAVECMRCAAWHALVPGIPSICSICVELSPSGCLHAGIISQALLSSAKSFRFYDCLDAQFWGPQGLGTASPHSSNTAANHTHITNLLVIIMLHHEHGCLVAAWVCSRCLASSGMAMQGVGRVLVTHSTKVHTTP